MVIWLYGKKSAQIDWWISPADFWILEFVTLLYLASFWPFRLGFASLNNIELNEYNISVIVCIQKRNHLHDQLRLHQQVSLYHFYSEMYINAGSIVPYKQQLTMLQLRKYVVLQLWFNLLY